jgi:hypothetical protein
VRIEEGPVPGELGDVVLLHQEVHTANPAVGDLPAAPERRRMVEPDGRTGWSNRTVPSTWMPRVSPRCDQVGQLGVAQQRLGRDAPDAQTDSAPILLLDHGGGVAELGGADGSD